ncbi:MAG: lipid A export permease/ATP-binding protein MsbA [Thermodesulfobacteriota bacterium]|nr:lipid A export permease/ATP-binding protein MsbA [Thermodesulfobacteriota bacterium]
MREKDVYIRIFKLIKPYIPKLIGSMICMVMVALLSTCQVFMVKPLIDEIFLNKDRMMLNLLPILLIALFIIKGMFYYGYSYTLNEIGQSVIKDLRNKIFVHLQSMPLSFYHKTPTGELISRIISDVTLIQGAVSHALVGILKDFLTVVCMIGYVFYLDWRMALASILFLPLACFPIVHFGKIHRRLSTKNQQITALVSNILYETITGTRIVKAFTSEEHEIRRFFNMIDRLFKVIMRDAKIKCLAHPIMELLGGIGVALIIFYGGNKVLNGTSTPGAFVSFLTALVMVYEPIKGVSKINSVIQKGVAAAVRVFDILDVKTDIIEKPDAKELPPIKKHIKLKQVSFSYDGAITVLHDINLKVDADEVLAIVGPSGGGKTTLINLIPRFFEITDGSISIDDLDIRDVTLKSLRSQIGMVTQQTILFNDTVRHNIAYGSRDCTEQEIIKAARAAHAIDFITNLPQGFDTVIGESGTKLSGGERQRISIARALLKNAPILILDEATSSLDTESEREVQKALDNLMQNRTTFVIAHRLSTIRNADRIIVIKDGRIIEQGTHDTLLPRNGVYKMLHDMQFSEK